MSKEFRFGLVLDETEATRLHKLAQRFETSRSQAIRQSLRLAAVRYGIKRDAEIANAVREML